VLGLARGAGAVVTNGRVVVTDAPASDDGASPEPLVAGDFALLQVKLRCTGETANWAAVARCLCHRCLALQYTQPPKLRRHLSVAFSNLFAL
jgi:hypothetical protein